MFTSAILHRFLGLCLLLLPGLAPAAAPEGAKPSAAHRLRPMDLIRLQVFQEPDLDRELRVSQDHTIVLPLIGVIQVRDLTVRETELLVTERYRADYLVNPQVNITVVEYSPRTVNVLGAVNSPGAVIIPPEQELTLLDAIARSGGFSRLANRTKVSLTRTLPDGRSSNLLINADQLVTGDTAGTDKLQPGDVLFVPERVL
jgi:polysaccharide biosynthesis/export protein